jgi:hypothetical protein
VSSPSTRCRSPLSADADNVQCDRAQPSCRRCTRLGLSCSGAPSTTDVVFRDERDVARRNSQRARREGEWSCIALAQKAEGPRRTSNAVYPRFEDACQYYWLKRHSHDLIAEPLRRDLDARAIDRFFLDWILYPGNDGIAPGLMHDLPAMYSGASSGSLLWHAVRALAFADIAQGQSQQGRSYSIKARQSYGAALVAMRKTIGEAGRFNQDSTLAALLLVDAFEVSKPADSDVMVLTSIPGSISEPGRAVGAARRRTEAFPDRARR